MVQVDFSNTDKFPVIPAGIYDAVLRDIEIRKSEAGNEYFQFQFEVVGGEWAGFRLPPLRNMINCGDRNYYLKQTLEVLGCLCEGIMDIEPSELLGSTAKLQINHEEYNGAERAAVTGIFTSDASAPSVDNDYPF